MLFLLLLEVGGGGEGRWSSKRLKGKEKKDDKGLEDIKRNKLIIIFVVGDVIVLGGIKI